MAANQQQAEQTEAQGGCRECDAVTLTDPFGRARVVHEPWCPQLWERR